MVCIEQPRLTTHCRAEGLDSSCYSMDAILQIEKKVWYHYFETEIRKELQGVDPYNIDAYTFFNDDLDWPLPPSLDPRINIGINGADLDLQKDPAYFEAFFLSVSSMIPPNIACIYLLESAQDGIQIISLGRLGIISETIQPVPEDSVSAFRKLCTSKHTTWTQYRHACADLQSRLIQPLTSVLESYNWIVFLPFGRVADVALHALPYKESVLALTHTVTYANSIITALMQTPVQEVPPSSEASKPYGILFSGPVGSKDNHGDDMEYLEYSACEGRVIAEALKSQMHLFVLHGQDVNFSNMSGLADFINVHDQDRPRALYHVASHFDGDDCDALRSSICLSHGENVPLDHWNDILLSCKGNATRLVFFNACLTGRPRSSSGLTALLLALSWTRPMFVMSTHWPLHDGSALVFSSLFYRHLADCGDALVAMQRAQSKMLSSPLIEVNAAAEDLVKAFPCSPFHIPPAELNQQRCALTRSPNEPWNKDETAVELVGACERLSLQEQEQEADEHKANDGPRVKRAKSPAAHPRQVPQLRPYYWAAYRMYCNPFTHGLSSEPILTNSDASDSHDVPLSPALPSVQMLCEAPQEAVLAVFVRSDEAGALIGDPHTLRGSTVQWLTRAARDGLPVAWRIMERFQVYRLIVGCGPVDLYKQLVALLNPRTEHEQQL